MNIQDLKPLTTSQYDACKVAAADRLKAKAGDKPSLKAARREYTPLVTLLDYVALVVFTAALLVSSAHIVTHAGGTAAASYAKLNQQAGIIIAPGVWAVVHQLGYILLAEASMILFMTMAAMDGTRRKWLYLLLALTAAAFVIAANLASGTHLLESLMPPAFTLGVGFRLEAIIAELLRRRAEVQARYETRLQAWQALQDDVETHPAWRSTLAAEVWQKLISLKANAAFTDAPTAVKRAAVWRELDRDNWTANLDAPPAAEDVDAVQQVAAPLAPAGALNAGFGSLAAVQPVHIPNGNGHHGAG